MSLRSLYGDSFMGWTTEESRFYSQQGSQISLLSKGSKTILVPTQSLLEVENSSLCILLFKNQWKYTSIPPHILKAWCLIKHGETLFLFLNTNHCFCIRFIPRGSILHNFNISFMLSSDIFWYKLLYDLWLYSLVFEVFLSLLLKISSSLRWWRTYLHVFTDVSEYHNAFFLGLSRPGRKLCLKFYWPTTDRCL